MIMDLGTVLPGSTIRIPFSTYSGTDGSGVTATNYTTADILLYKDGSTTERASTAGYTATTDFDSKTGKQLIIIDLADNTTAGFFAAGSEYLGAIDAITVDGGTTGGWAFRFRIGYPNALLDTTIAALASQTSFTLTNGPAEDDALNDHWAIIHDVASAVQMSRVQILDYTGSTKTVTLAAGATFTVAASDNFSLMGPMPLQVTVLGRKLDVSSTGEAGIDWANVGSPMTTVALTGTTVASTQKVDIETIKTNPVVNAGTVTFPTTATLASTTNITAGTIATVTTLTNAPSDSSGVTTLLSRLSSARAGYLDNLSAGAVALASSLSTLQTDMTTLLGRITSSLFTGITSLAQWLGLIAGKQTGNSTARTELRATGAGSGTYDETTDSVEALRDRGDAAWVTGTTPPTAAAIADQVWGEAIADHSGTAGSTAESLNAAGSAGDPWTTAIPGAYGAGSAGYIVGNRIDAAISSRLASASYSAPPSAATIASQVRTELATELARIDAAVSTRLATAGYTVPLDAAGTRSALGMASANLDTQLAALDTLLDTAIANIAALNNISTAQVLTQVNTALDTAISELGVGAPTATPSLRTGLMLLYMALRNRGTTTATAQTIQNDAGTTIATATLSDDATTYTKTEFA